MDNSYLFVKGIKVFSSIAMTVLEHGEFRYAFVQSLGEDLLYYCDEQNAFLNDTRLVIQPSEPVMIATYAGRFDSFDYLSQLAKLPKNYYVLNTGGPLLSAMVASNHFSATVDLKPTKFHDQAGVFIAQKAGAFVVTIDGKQISLDPTIRQQVITANSEALLRELQQSLQ